MAERLTPAEREEIREFVRWLYARSGHRSWAAFARAAGVSEFGLSEWRSGRGMPNALNLLRLLRAADALTGEAPVHHESLEDAVAQLVDQQAALTREVRHLTAELQDPAQAPATPKRRGSKRR